MLKFYLLAIAFSVCGLMANAQVIYVNQNASGSNSGGSWTDAYNDLSDALNDISGDEIWIATGTYKPGGASPDTLSRFTIDRNLSLYGGFAGGETSIDDRDIEANPTLLSGDINGDDVAMNFTDFKEDNTLHVVYVDSLINGFVTFDGLSIEGGHNNSALVGDDGYLYSGGGIYALSTIFVNQCTFSHNYSRTGAAIFLSGDDASESSIELSNFSQNVATSQGCFYLEELATGGIRNCTFSNNTTNRGALYPAYCANLEIDNCVFENNNNPTGFGAGMFSWQNRFLILTNCTFAGNTAQNAAGIYFDGRELNTEDPENIIINNCTFTDNSTSGYGGGGFYVFRDSYTLTNSVFDGNVAGNSGGAIVNGGDDKTYIIENCEFKGGSAAFGSGMTNYGANSFATIRNCLFEENFAETSGAGMINGFLADVTIDSCDFINNTARWGGGMYNQNDSTRVGVSNSYFTGNSVENFGGAINIAGGIDFTISGCEFFGNQANFGGAVAISEDSLDLARLTLSNSIFNLNVAETQGGALNIDNADTEITSCIFYSNIAVDPGTGGAISTNASGTSILEVSILNSTLAVNTGVLSNGIAAFTADDAVSNITMQNTILYNPDGVNYAIEDGAPTVTSMGGNFCSDLSLLTELTGTNDIVDEDLDPGFVDVSSEDFHLLSSSPCVDAGIDAGAPLLDLEGNPRVGITDKGAYEFQGVPDGINEVLIANDNQLKMSPNPAVDLVMIELENEWKGVLQIRIMNAMGQIVESFEVEKKSSNLKLDRQLNNLTPGVYQLTASNGQQMLALPFMKR